MEKSQNAFVEKLLIISKVINEKMKHLNDLCWSHPCISLFLGSQLLNLVIEMLCRRSVIKGFLYMVTSPVRFEYNALIVLLTLSVSIMFRKRVFALASISVSWILLAVINFILLGFRTTPLAAIDFSIYKSVWSITGKYFSKWKIAFAIIFVIALIAGGILLWRKTKKQPVRYVRSSIIVACMCVAFFVITSFSLNTNIISSKFSNIADAYKDYGFAYCFATSVVDRGIDEPEDYSEDKMEEVIKSINASGSSDNDVPIGTNEKPNIIMVQLESFFDVNHLKDYSFSENPVPNFTSLKKKNSSGFMTVKSVGAGTANTEFEVLTGMDLDFFGTGEYPYKTVLMSKTCESVNYDLKEQGYVCHAIHNNSATFYDRNKVFPNLGFDTFTSKEFMQDVTPNPIGWVKDSCLLPEITKALDSTPDQDFIYTITVQGHGKYPDEVIDDTQTITAASIKFDGNEAWKNRFEYYINQLHETDEFVGNLINELDNYYEPTVVVFYGDHMPNLDISEEDLSEGNMFTTEYVIWSNYDMEAQDKDLNAYQLSSEVLKRVGYSNGIITKLHQRYQNNPNYREVLEMIEYDMFYGKNKSYDTNTIFEPTAMKMGTSDREIEDVSVVDNLMYVGGNEFNKWTVICVDGERKRTVLINDSTVMTEMDDSYYGKPITVAQVGHDKEGLSESQPYYVSPPAISIDDQASADLAVPSEEAQKQIEEEPSTI